jgi:hypothetical protein
MVKPIDHDTTSAMATGLTGAAKGAVKGVLTVGAAGGILSALVAAPIALFAGGTVATAATAAGIAFLAAGIVTAVAVGSWGAIIGGLFGMAKGGSKVTAEKVAYQKRAEQRAHTREIETNNQQMVGMQQGYQAGFQEGQQYVVAQLQAAHEQMLASGAGISQQPGDKAAKVAQQRDAQLGAAPQMA